jgi:hypothetical protein
MTRTVMYPMLKTSMVEEDEKKSLMEESIDPTTFYWII